MSQERSVFRLNLVHLYSTIRDLIFYHTISPFYMKRIFHIIILALLASPLLAQQEQLLQVVTKQIEKTLKYQKGDIIYINGEKADVRIATWDKKQVHVILELVAKHQDKATAEGDLELMSYLIDRAGSKINVSNHLVKNKKDRKASSQLKAYYVITIPKDCPVDLRNHFGKAELVNLRQELDVRSEFCQILLENVKGEVGIETRFGDVTGEKLDGEFRIASVRSDITLTQLSGSFNIKAKYGKIKIDAEHSLIDLNIDAEKSDIILLNPSLATHNFNLTAFYGKITVPEDMQFHFKEQNEMVNKAELNLPSTEKKVSIQTSFGSIVVARMEM